MGDVMDLKSLKIACFAHQISHYHLARYRAAAPMFRSLTVVAATNDADFSEFLASDVNEISVVRLFDRRSDYLRALKSNELRRMIHRTLDQLNPDIIAVAGWSFAESLSAIGWARQHDARVIMMSESQNNDSRRWRPRELLKSRVVKACDAALVGGTLQREYIVSLGMPEKSVFLGYDTVDNRHFARGAEKARANAAALRTQLGLPDRYILAAARFVSKKNLVRLIKSFERAILLTNTDHALVILGGGPDHSSIEASIAHSALKDRILLPGFKGYEVLPYFYGLAEIFAHVSVREQWGLVVNEAAAAGLPIIVSNRCGAAAELVLDGSNGYLVDPFDVEEIAQRLGAIMGASDEQRAAMRAESQKIVGNWGVERFADGLRLAAEVAISRPARALRPWDNAFMLFISHFFINSVS